MILSWRHNFLFLKTVKTAGTSIEADLAGLVEDDAIVTPITPPIEGHAPRNFAHPKGNFVNHMRASDVRDRIGAEAFAGLFKFCIEREPVSKCISHFHMLKRAQATAAQYADVSWDDYCWAGNFPVEILRYAEPAGAGFRLLVDRVLPYESMEQDLPELLQARGVEGFSLQTRAKSEFSHARMVTEDDVTDAQRKTIYGAFRKSLKLHGLYPHALA